MSTQVVRTLEKKQDEQIPSHDWMSFLGIRVQALTASDLVGAIRENAHSRRPLIISNHNLHSFCIFHRDERMQEFHRVANMTHIDGMSLIALGRMCGQPLKREHRTGYMDLLPELLEAASREGWRVFYLGSKPGVAAKASILLRKRYSGLQMKTHHGYFDAAPGSRENEAILQEIAAYAPQVLLVGMGMPRQETWLLQNRDRIQASAVLCSGALMDYVAGEIATPPRWLGQIGLEWLYRLVTEPNRLFHRYLVEPWSVLGIILKELTVNRAARD
jgi:N-acetylglucosaminyldiphosphoundecaprenol N-acetyl-beta-D-mannosaminyltransferase